MMISIGINSGTSLDGVDVALVKHENNHHILLKFKCYPYTKELKNKILDASSLDKSNIRLICSLHKELGIYYKDKVEEFLKDTNTLIDDVDFISCHGQTVWHNPVESKDYVRSTLQLGDASVMAYYFNKTVVYDFRQLDISAGGIGAPLVGICNYYLFKEMAPVIFLNIGGISNLTYIKESATLDDIIAFDTGPGNMLIDGLMKILYNKDYDDSGTIAKNGVVNQDLLDYLLDDEYYKLDYPKSTGREKYNQEYIDNVLKFSKIHSICNNDIITTITKLTSICVKNAIDKYFKDFSGKLVVSGGGSKNKYIIDTLKDDKYQVLTSDELNINSDALEALSFAILGYLRLHNMPSNLKQVTNALDFVSLGSIIYKPR